MDITLKISIHALLAESDDVATMPILRQHDFYPRSPCGERRALPLLRPSVLNFYPRSPCGERLAYSHIAACKCNFYPRSPCGERLISSSVLPRIG